LSKKNTQLKKLVLSGVGFGSMLDVTDDARSKVNHYP